MILISRRERLPVGFRQQLAGIVEPSTIMKALCWSLLCLLTVAACSGRAPKATDSAADPASWVCEATPNQEDWACRRDGEEPDS